MRARRLITITLPLLLAACGAPAANTDSGTEVSVEPSQETQVVIMPMPGKNVALSNHGKEMFFALGAMEGVGGTPANGVTDMHVFSDGATIGSVQVNINMPEDGSFYEAWLAKNDGRPALSLGHLTTPFGDVRHSLRYEQTDDLRVYTQVVVTLERDDGDPSASSAVVAKGLLKTQKRG